MGLLIFILPRDYKKKNLIWFKIEIKLTSKWAPVGDNAWQSLDSYNLWCIAWIPCTFKGGLCRMYRWKGKKGMWGRGDYFHNLIFNQWRRGSNSFTKICFIVVKTRRICSTRLFCVKIRNPFLFFIFTLITPDVFLSTDALARVFKKVINIVKVLNVTLLLTPMIIKISVTWMLMRSLSPTRW